MDSISSLSSATEAQELVNQKPEEFSKLLQVSKLSLYRIFIFVVYYQEIRGEFFDIIETAPKPGIPYYDPKPLTDLKESLHNMEE